ncbi:acyl-CoA thioesterase [Micrococcus sp. M4NT]|uniref:acyl-CoA thioesterase n=1 Tax=Micrococcus sp. M4NT TaxID=2957501 RepID=UPI0029C063AF|nr:hotdog domain-containing protein [Micrococcus sp. M4NT]
MKHIGALSLDFRADSFDHPSGIVDAGTAISWIDKVCYAVAASWSGSFVRARYMGNMQFRHAVPVDTQATVQARVVHTDGSDVHVQTRLMLPEIPDAAGDPTVCTSSIAVYSAEEGGARLTVPQWVPATPNQVERDEQARRSTVARREVERGMAELPFPASAADLEEMTTLSFLAPTSEATVGGTVNAGAVMRWVDEAAGVCAARWTGHENVVAVFAGGVRFVRNVRVGDLVRVDALLVHTTDRSMHVALRVYAGRRTSRRPRLVAHSISVMVDVSDEGRAGVVRRYVPVSEAARRLEESAVELVRLRSEMGAAWTYARP